MSRPLAPSRWSVASQVEKDTGTGIPSTDEVLPHYYGTHEKDASHRAVAGIHNQSNTGGRATPPGPESGCLGHTGVDSEQLGGGPGVDSACRAATAGVGSRGAPSTDRAGDYPGESVGQQEAGTAVGRSALRLGTALFVTLLPWAICPTVLLLVIGVAEGEVPRVRQNILTGDDSAKIEGGRPGGEYIRLLIRDGSLSPRYSLFGYRLQVKFKEKI